MNWLERKVVRLAWRRLEAKMPQIKRWTPLVAGGFLVIGVLLRAFGFHQAAAFLEGLLGAVSLTDQSPVSASELTAAVALAGGIVLKFRSKYRGVKASKVAPGAAGALVVALIAAPVVFVWTSIIAHAQEEPAYVTDESGKPLYRLVPVESDPPPAPCECGVREDGACKPCGDPGPSEGQCGPELPLCPAGQNCVEHKCVPGGGESPPPAECLCGKKEDGSCKPCPPSPPAPPTPPGPPSPPPPSPPQPPPDGSPIGFGVASRAGEGGPVTTLPVGSNEAALRAAILKPGARTVQFAAGTHVIQLTQPLVISGAGNAGLFLDGQGANVTIIQPAWNVIGVRFARSGGSDLRIRNIRFQGAWTFGNFSHTNDAAVLEFDGTNTPNARIYLENITVCCGVDSAPDFYGGNKDVSVVYSLIHSSLHPMTVSSTGMRLEGDPDARERMTFYGNVFARNGERQPQLKRGAYDIDYVNNIVYDWRPDFWGNPPPAYTGYGLRVQDDDPRGVDRLNVIGNLFLAKTGAPEGDCMLGDTPKCDGGAPCSAKLQSAWLHFSQNTFTPQHPSFECQSTASGQSPVPRPYSLPSLSRAQLLQQVGASARTAAEQAMLNEIAARLGQ